MGKSMKETAENVRNSVGAENRHSCQGRFYLSCDCAQITVRM